MKLVAEYESIVDAEQVSRLLESKGIATFVSSKRSAHIPALFGGASSVGLWVVVRDQYYDAIQLLSDSDYEVRFRLSRIEMERVKNSVRWADNSEVIQLLFRILGIVVIFSTAVWVLTKL